MRLVSALVLVLAACAAEDDEPAGMDAPPAGTPDAAPPPPTQFEMSRLELRYETTDGDGFQGVAWLDYDADGLLDAYVTNGKGHMNALFKNQGGGAFTDVAAEAGVANGGGSAGVVAGDLDNDGDTDLFVTGEGGVFGAGHTATRVYRNEGDGTFVDVTDGSGIAEFGWGAALGDIDGDADLDVFVAYPGPTTGSVPPPSHLYRNEGGLVFTEIGVQAGVATTYGSCSTAFAHFDDDDLLDLLVGNCSEVMLIGKPIELFINQGDGTFVDVARDVGITEWGFWMGVAIGDIDHDLDMDFFSTNIGVSTGNWWHALYRNEGDGTFAEISGAAGVREWEFGWGASFADFDGDSWEDLVMTGSCPHPPLVMIGPGRGNPTRLFFNEGGGDNTFREESGPLGIDLSEYFTSGLAIADFENVGRPSILVGLGTTPGAVGKPIVFRNMGATANHWLTVRTVGTTSNRDGVGARVYLSSGDLSLYKERIAGSSFLSSESPWLHFGLGERTVVDSLVVRWPSGRVESFPVSGVDRMITVTEGEGDPQG